MSSPTGIAFSDRLPTHAGYQPYGEQVQFEHENVETLEPGLDIRSALLEEQAA